MAGNAADDPLYVPAVDRVLQIIDGLGLLFVGDCKMFYVRWLGVARLDEQNARH